MSNPAEPERQPDDKELTSRSVAVGCITLTRYLRSKDPILAVYLASALSQAANAGLSKSDLVLLEMMLQTAK